MKKIVVMPVKNEDWILEKTLTAMSFWADHIIIADQGSDDRTVEICEKFDKVILINNPTIGLNQSRARQILLDEVRQRFGYDNIIAALDADEFFTANAIFDVRFNEFLQHISPGTSVVLQWLMLHRTVYSYVHDGSIWSDNWKHFIFRDDGKHSFAHEKTSEPRMPTAYMRNSVRYEAVKVFHFQFLAQQRMLAKQRRYRVCDVGGDFSWRHILSINRMYFETKAIAKTVRTTKTESDWWNGYPEHVALWQEDPVQLYWYDREILGKLVSDGLFRYAWLDIWDVDWEKKRRIAIEAGYSDVPRDSLGDPRTWYIKLYHRYGQYVVYYTVWLVRFFKKRLIC